MSLTAEPVATATGFVEHCHIGWSCGYGVALEDIAQWGAYSTARMSRSFNPGYEVSPTLFLIGPDQQVLWCDGQVRPRHAEHAEDLIHRLDDAIETALKGLPAASH